MPAPEELPVARPRRITTGPAGPLLTPLAPTTSDGQPRRVTSVAAEVISHPVPSGRITSVAAEAISKPVPSARVTADVAEAVIRIFNPKARITAEAVEVVYRNQYDIVWISWTEFT